MGSGTPAGSGGGDGPAETGAGAGTAPTEVGGEGSARQTGDASRRSSATSDVLRVEVGESSSERRVWRDRSVKDTSEREIFRYDWQSSGDRDAGWGR